MRRFHGGLWLGLGAVFLLAPWGNLAAQEGRVTIAPRVGYLAWDKAAGIQDPILQSDLCDFPEVGSECVGAGNNFTVGLSALYGFTPYLRGGVSFEVSRPVVNGAYFDAVELNTPGVSRLVFVSQRLTVAAYGAVVEFAPWRTRVTPFFEAGIGGYLLYLDPEKSNGFEKFHDFAATVGGGLDIPIREGTAFRVHVRDLILTGWERDHLNAVDPSTANTRFPDLVPVPPEADSVLHNLWISIGFTFAPGAAR